MILSGQEIESEIKRGNIEITPFERDQLNANSYNVRLGANLLTYQGEYLDAKKDNPTATVKIPERGLWLRKGELYLAETVEETFSEKFVPLLVGRSSIGRLGMFVHVSAGFGDAGWRGKWTLEIVPIKNICVYPGIKIAQIYFEPLLGSFVGGYAAQKFAKYQNAVGVQSSRLFTEFVDNATDR